MACTTCRWLFCALLVAAIGGCGSARDVEASGSGGDVGASEDDGEADGDDGSKLDVGGCGCGFVDGCCPDECPVVDLDCTGQCGGGDIRDVGPLALGDGTGSLSHARMDTGYAVVSGISVDEQIVLAFTDDEGVVDPATVSRRPGFHPEVAYNGLEVLLAYDVGPDLWQDSQLHVARVAPDGTGLGDTLVDPESGHIQTISAVWHPTAQQWALVWQLSPGGFSPRIRFARLAADGTLIPGSLLELSDPTDLAQLGDARALIAIPEGYAVAIAHSDDLELVRLDTEGRRLSGSSLPTVGQPFNVTIAAGDDSFGLAWQVSPDALGFEVVFARADGDGTLDPDSQMTWPEGSDLSFGNPTVVWDGLRYHAVWLAGDGIGNSLLLHGTPTDTLPGTLVTFAPSYAWFPRALWNGCELVVAYSEGEPSTPTDPRLLFVPGPELVPEG